MKNLRQHSCLKIESNIHLDHLMVIHSMFYMSIRCMCVCWAFIIPTFDSTYRVSTS